MEWHVRLDAGSASPLQSAYAGMGAGVAAPHAAALAGTDGKRGCAAQPDYDPTCYLCPGNRARAACAIRRYTSTFVFENDFAALKPGTPLERFERDGLLIAESEPGICRVVCFSPRHNLTSPTWIRPICARWWTRGSSSIVELGARTGNQLRADFRKSRRHDGREQSAPALPDLVEPLGLPNEIAKEQIASWRGGQSAAPACSATMRAWNRRAANASWKRTIASWRSCPSGPSGRSRPW